MNLQQQPRKNNSTNRSPYPATKRTHDLNIGTWNIRTLLRAGAMVETANEMQRLKIDILALQEIRWKDAGEINKINFSFFYSGAERSGKNGTGFMISKTVKKHLLGFNPINDRICSLRIKGKFNNITLVSVYAPTEDADEQLKDNFYSELEKTCEKIGSFDTVIVLGDFNARIGKEDYVHAIAGRHSLHEATSSNGLRLAQFASSLQFFIKSTSFPHKRIHKGTWKMPGSDIVNQIDHILINKRRMSCITDTHTCRSADADTDHYLVKARFKQKLSIVAKTKGTKKPIWDTDKLSNLKTRNAFSHAFKEIIRGSVNKNKNENGNDMCPSVDQSWEMIKNALLTTALKCVGLKKRKKNEDWFDDECAKIMEEKTLARKKMLERNTRTSLENYVTKRKAATKLCRKKKREALKAKIMEIDNNFNFKKSKLFFKGLKEQTRAYQPRLNICKAQNGEHLTEKEQILQRWKSYFEDLYNVPTGSTCAELRSPNTPEDALDSLSAPTLDDVVRLVQRTKANKAPGEDSITSELLKALDPDALKPLHNLLVRVWREETLPSAWLTGIIIPIHKKGDKTNCSNYRGITLLNVCYKMFSTLLSERIQALAEQVLGEYQCGFRPNRSTIDQAFLLKQNIDKCLESGCDVHLLFIDFKQAFDSIHRESIANAMHELGIPSKLARLTMLTLKGTKGRVSIQQNMTSAFNINSGVKQGDALSTTIFNLVLHYAIKDFTRSGHLFSRTTLTIAYADDIAIAARSRRYLDDTFLAIEKNARSVGLTINKSKTKYMRISKGKRKTFGVINIENFSFESVAKFTYLGVLISSDSSMQDCISDRIMAANRAYYANINLLKSRSLSRRCKLAIYKSLIRPVLTYGAEIWSMTLADEERLRIFERKILRKVFGPIREEDGEYRIRLNKELLSLCNGEDIVRFIKSQRIRWAGHIIRMDDGRPQKLLLHYNPFCSRPRGRPKTTWLHNVTEDLKKLGVKNWKSLALDRLEWRKIAEAAKAHPGL